MPPLEIASSLCKPIFKNIKQLASERAHGVACRNDPAQLCYVDVYVMGHCGAHKSTLTHFDVSLWDESLVYTRTVASIWFTVTQEAKANPPWLWIRAWSTVICSHIGYGIYYRPQCIIGHWIFSTAERISSRLARICSTDNTKTDYTKLEESASSFPDEKA